MADNEEKLVKMLKYVSEHNDFYKNRIKEYGITNPLDITQWPVLTRKELQENRYNMFSDGYKAKYLCHQLKISTSSGSTGAPVYVYWDKCDYWNSIASLWRKRKKWYGILPNDKFVSFTLGYLRPNDYSQGVIYSENGNQLLFNAASLDSEEAYTIAIKHIINYDPKWIYVQPYILKQLIVCCKKSNIGIPKSLKYIESVGEILLPQLKAESNNYFKVPISNLYGSEENNGIAFECPNGRMHLLEENVYVENNAIITNLNNHAFPLIRYNQGDLIDISCTQEQCKCGTNSNCIKVIKGRTRQSIDISEITLNPYMLSEIIDYANNQFNGMIIKYSFTYSISMNNLRCCIAISNENKDWENAITKEVYNSLFRRLSIIKNISIDVFVTRNIVSTSKNNILTII